MIDLEATFEKLEHEQGGQPERSGAQEELFLELTELKHNLRKTQQFFDEQEGLEQEVGRGPSSSQDEAGRGAASSSASWPESS